MAEPKQKLPSNLSAELDQILRSAGEATRAGDEGKGIELGESAWDMLPEPKGSWDFYPQVIAKNMVGKYVKQGDVSGARKWMKTVNELYGPTNHFALMIEGDGLFSLGLESEAFDVFATIFRVFGRNGFKAEQRKYLEFYLERSARQ